MTGDSAAGPGAAVGEARLVALTRHLMFRHAFGMSDRERAAQWKAAKKLPDVMRYWRGEATGILAAIDAASRPAPEPGDGGGAMPDRDGLDGTARLCRALYGRKERARDYLGGSDARMLHDAADRLAASGSGDGGGDARLRAEVERLTRERDEAREDRRALTRALTGLTCNGSEFFVRRGDEYVADIPACLAWINRAKQDAVRGRIDAIHRQKEAEDRAATAERALGEARDVLRQVEWAGRRNSIPCCSVCRGYQPGRVAERVGGGHAPGCALAAQFAGPARGQDGAATSDPVCQVWETDCVAASPAPTTGKSAVVADPAEPGRAGVRRADVLRDEARQLLIEADALDGRNHRVTEIVRVEPRPFIFDDPDEEQP